MPDQPDRPSEAPGLLIDRIKDFVDSAGPSDQIRVAMYNWRDGADAVGLAEALVDAARKKADVRIVLDQKAKGSAATRLLEKAPRLRVTYCHAKGGEQSSCTDKRTSGINHNTFFLFDVDGAKTVIQSSQNLTEGQLAA